MNKRAKMPSPKEIVSYWKNSGHRLDDGQFVEGQCFACGCLSILERCHILAVGLGGCNSVENLHLLCKHCHLTSESLSGDFYWEWYENMLENYFDFGIRRLTPIMDILKTKAQEKGLYKTEDLFALLVKENLPLGWKCDDKTC